MRPALALVPLSASFGVNENGGVSAGERLVDPNTNNKSNGSSYSVWCLGNGEGGRAAAIGTGGGGVRVAAIGTGGGGGRAAAAAGASMIGAGTFTNSGMSCFSNERMSILQNIICFPYLFFFKPQSIPQVLYTCWTSSVAASSVSRL